LQDQLTVAGRLLPSDVAILVKTGASVIETRLPVHFDHELANLSHPIQIYSDHETMFRGHHVVDILKDVPERVSQQHDFQPYFAQKDQLAKGASLDSLEGGWSLDKYKLIPILNDAYKRFPTAKWWVNIEADTYLFVDNLMRWLSSLDHHGMDFFGTPVLIVDCGCWFAHGGVSQNVYDVYADQQW
jgi:hypothetical protein